MAGSSSLRASDSDREQTAERLRHAMAEGRLTAGELEERLDELYRTRTYGELDALVADLPAGRASRAVRPRPWWLGLAGAGVLLLAVLGMLAGTTGHAGDGVEGPRHGGPLGSVGPGPGAHHLMIAGVSRLLVFVLLAACAALAWRFMRSRDAEGD